MSTTTSSTPSTTTTNATFSLYEQGATGSLPLFVVEVLAFLAIFRRDLIVAKRDFIGNLIQAMVTPGFFLFIFGRVLPQTGVASPGYAALLLPGMVGMSLLLTGLTNVTLSLVLDIGNEREIEDRLLAPLPAAFVAMERVLFAALYSLIASALVFPLAYLILGSSFQMRTDAIGLLICLMILSALAGAALGLTLGTSVKPEQIGLLNALIILPLIFTGCIYFSWSALSSMRWFQAVTLFNPLTYAAEGLRGVMTPGLHGQALPVLGIQCVLLGLAGTLVVFLSLGIRGFLRRAIR
jgi:ABC-2 type transport system permease protein